MTRIAGLIIVILLIALVQVPGMLRKKMIKDLAAYSVLLLFGTALFIGQILHLKIPNPVDFIIYLFEPLGKIIFTP
ncbi:hypothetical protein [Paenibacillus eucommiae]|uniref:Uncharacterized protein n=1 Tax=Paenibacillus eucommiae TaxID=1355755 RepID=A0ABS4IXV9_9BACL|nr:hypothetical protein [Paenibacillus eucommiae]MBP1992421.1 hypothetical protein [Paenibacillus eucommiae]